jgi:tRNA (guanine10-N2)-methyltransferase
VIGGDIDYRVLSGSKVGHKNVKCEIEGQLNVKSNFEHYQIAVQDFIATDISYTHFARKELFDAIVCDPPYGLRASS